MSERVIKAGFTRSILISLSFANLCYLRVWSEILTYTEADGYWMPHAPTQAEIAAVMVNVLVLATIAAAASAWISRQNDTATRRWEEVAFLVCMLVPLNAVRSVLASNVSGMSFLRSHALTTFGVWGVVALICLLAAIGVFIVIRWRPSLVRFVAGALLAFSPFVAVTFAQGVRALTRPTDDRFADNPSKPLSKEVASNNRVVWLIFDSLDYRLPFLDRPDDLQLPEFDQLRRESFFALNAQQCSPATGASIPSYLTGRIVRGFREHSPRELRVRFQGSDEWEDLSAQTTLLHSARDRGANVAVAGWYLPYCRGFSTTFAECQSWPMERQYNSMGDSFPELLVNQTRSLLETNIFSPFGQSLTTVAHARAYEEILQTGARLAADRSIDLALVHFSVPHPPHIYDRKTRTLSRGNSPLEGYIDSLALASRTLGQVREAIHDSGLSDVTTLIVTSDHACRAGPLIDGKTDTRIPLIVRFPRDTRPVEYEPSFSSVALHDIVQASLNSELNTAQALQGWLDSRM